MKKKKKTPARAKSRRRSDELPAASIGQMTELMKLVADETRLRIVSYLCFHEELHVAAICQRIGQSQPAVSHHLALMREAGLLKVRKDGRFNFYRLSLDPVKSMLDIVFANLPSEKNTIKVPGYTLRQSA